MTTCGKVRSARHKMTYNADMTEAPATTGPDGNCHGPRLWSTGVDPFTPACPAGI